MKLEDFCYINPAKTLTKNENYEFVEMTDIESGKRYVYSKRHKKFNGSYSKFSSGDTLMAKITPCLENGKIAQYIGNKDAFGSTEFIVFREKRNVSLNDFLFYLIRSENVKEPAIKSMTGACGRQRANIDTIKNINVQEYSIKYQKKVISILSNYDDLIENNNMRIKILEEMAQKIYMQWFVDFKFPGRETTTFKDSELGKIPQDWGICDIGKICSELTRGVTPKYKEGSKRYIINQKVNRGFSLDLQHLKELDDSLTVPENKYAHQRDILLNSLGEGTIGRVHYYYGENKLYPIDQHMTILRPGQYIGAYLYFYLASFEGQNRLNGLKTGGTNMTMLNISLLRNFEVVVPGLEILKKFDNITHRIFSLKVVLEKKNKIIKQTRDMLLPKLISGEIDVENMNIV